MPPRLVRHRSDFTVIDLGFRGFVASSAPYQPAEASLIVFRRVGEDFKPPDLKGFYQKVRRELGRADAVVLLTSVDLEKKLAVEYLKDPPGIAAVSAGLSTPACPGSGSYEPLKMHTINVAIGVDVSLEASGLLDLYRVTVEAKTLAAVELLLRCRHRSPGTATDAVVVIARPGGMLEGYITAGMATRLGSNVAEAVYRLVSSLGMESLGAEGIIRNALGYSLEGLANLALEAYRSAPVPGVPEDEVRSLARSILEGALRDPNVIALVVAARDLDLRGIAGAIPGIPGEEFARDPRDLVADELLATALSLYLAGFKGLLATYWVERLKESGRINLKAPAFEDDVISALLGSVLSMVYDRLLPRR